MRNEDRYWFHQNPSSGLGYEISALTFLPLKMLIFIAKKYAFLWCGGQGCSIFTHNGEKNKQNPFNFRLKFLGVLHHDAPYLKSAKKIFPKPMSKD